MNRSPWPIYLLVAALAAASCFGFFRLFELRFQAGDVYPPYSSLRTDPLGMEILHDALREAPGFNVSRNYAPLDKVRDPGGATIIYAGVSTEPWQIEDVAKFEAVARNGGRIILAFLPAETAPFDNEPGGKLADKKKAANGSKPETEPTYVDLRKILKAWGVTLANRATEPRPNSSPFTNRSLLPETEPTLPWHPAPCFPNPSPAWRVLYRCEGVPSMIERPYGDGSLLLIADSYFLSNEAMRGDRAPRLLAWLVGSRPRVIFDETHLGVSEHPGIATLVRKYRLGGLLAAIALLAFLFVWHASASFLPPRPDHDETGIVTGRDSTAGFVSLLRRGIAPSRLIEVCMVQWKKSFAHQTGRQAGMIARIDSAALGGSRDPVGTYRAISQILAEKK